MISTIPAGGHYVHGVKRKLVYRQQQTEITTQIFILNTLSSRRISAANAIANTTLISMQSVIIL